MNAVVTDDTGRSPYNRLIDGVFVPDGGAGPVHLDSVGHRFDGFPQTTGDTFGSIWARAAEIKPDQRAPKPKILGLRDGGAADSSCRKAAVC